MLAWLIYGVVAFAVTSVFMFIDRHRDFNIDEFLGYIVMGALWPVELLLGVIYGLGIVLCSPFMFLAWLFRKI